MNVKDETGFSERFWPQSANTSDVEGFEYRINGYPVALLYMALEAYRFTVDQDQIDFGMGNTFLSSRNIQVFILLYPVIMESVEIG